MWGRKPIEIEAFGDRIHSFGCRRRDEGGLEMYLGVYGEENLEIRVSLSEDETALVRDQVMKNGAIEKPTKDKKLN